MNKQNAAISHKAFPLFWLPLAGQLLCMVLPFLLLICNRSEEEYTGPFFSFFLFATLFGIGNVICAVRLGLKRKAAVLRPLVLWGKLAFSALVTVGALFFVTAVLLLGMLFTAFAGFFGLVGTLAVAFWVLVWLYCMGLSLSAYAIAFVWVEVKEKRMKPAVAVTHTIFQFFIVSDLLDAIIVFCTTRPAKPPSAKQNEFENKGAKPAATL